MEKASGWEIYGHSYAFPSGQRDETDLMLVGRIRALALVVKAALRREAA
jgi:hypothetical protein